MREFKKLPLELFIGYDIEQNSRVIELDASEMVEKYPSGILQLVCKRPGEETTYIAPSFEQDGGTLRWTLTSYDVEKAGQGLAIVALVDTSEKSVKVLASHKIRTGIEEGLHFRDAEKVDPDDSLIARVLAAVSQAQAYAHDAKEEADRAKAALDDVGDAKDQAIADIKAKGTETLDSIPSDYTALSGDVSDLKSAVTNDFDVTRSKMRLVESSNLLSGSTVGYRTANGNYGNSSSYRYTDKIPVDAGDVISLWVVNKTHTTFQQMNARFTCALDNDETPVTASGTDSNISSYTVPSGIAFVQFSIAKSYFDTYDIMIVKSSTAPTVYQPYFDPYYAATPEFMPRPYKNGIGYESFIKATSTGINIELPSTNIVKNLLYAFSSAIGNDFTNLVIGSGYPNGSYKSYITIDATNLTFNVNGSDYVYPHGLTIADYIKITIDINDNTKAKVTLTSGGSQFTKTLGWYGFHTEKYAVFSSNGTFTNAVFTVAFKDINADAYIFGDSYVAILESTSKWSHWLVADGYSDNALINAYPGENSANALNALKTVLSVGCPKYLLWCLGMNDGGDTDAETPSAAWMAGINKVLELCEANDITPVFATIPTVPAYNHEAKNAWVRSSGYIYVDFARAVGANSSGVWFSGMLSTDNIHPSELGAKALWHQVLCDFPEITM